MLYFSLSKPLEAQASPDALADQEKLVGLAVQAKADVKVVRVALVLAQAGLTLLLMPSLVAPNKANAADAKNRAAD